MMAHSRFAGLRFIGALLAVLFPLCAIAQTPGTLDTTFGGTGGVVTAVSPAGGDDRVRAMVLQPDGKIVLGGTCEDDFCLVRYLPNGTLDATFGAAGRVIQNVVGTDNAYAMALQPDGKFVLVGTCIPNLTLTSTMCAARFTTTGALDVTFGGGGTGWITVDITSGGDVARAVALQGDGKIVMAGVCTGFISPTLQDFCLVRLNSDGTLDTSFNGTGKVVTTFGGSGLNQGANAVAVQPDGKIVAAGYCHVGSFDSFCVARYEANGVQLDGTFGSGAGYVTKQLFASYNSRAYAIMLQPNGKMLVGGECGSALCMIRYLATGAPDTSFGVNGVVGTAGTTSYEGKTGALALAPDGTVMHAGWSNPGPGIDYRRIERYAYDGTPPAGFFTPTIIASHYINGEAQGWNAIAMQRDGKVVVASSGAEASGLVGDFLVARYHGFATEVGNCSLDIDGDGKVLATTDALIQARVALGMTGSAVTNGITFAPHAQRQNWADIRSYLITQCGMMIP